MSKMPDYSEKIASTYDEGVLEYSEFFSSPHDFIQEERDLFVAGIKKGAHILDCGCGPGQDSEYFSNLGFRLTGIDLSKKFIEMAQKRAPKCTFLQMDIKKLKFPIESFDAAWLSFSFLHIHKKDALMCLKEIKKILKTEGSLMIALHRADQSNWVEARISGLERNCFVQEWVEEDFVSLMKEASFKIVHIRSFERPGGRFPLLTLLARV